MHYLIDPAPPHDDLLEMAATMLVYADAEDLRREQPALVEKLLLVRRMVHRVKPAGTLASSQVVATIIALHLNPP